MVYGRYNEVVNGVYKPTNITGGHHPVKYTSYPCHLSIKWSIKKTNQRARLGISTILGNLGIY